MRWWRIQYVCCDLVWSVFQSPVCCYWRLCLKIFESVPPASAVALGHVQVQGESQSRLCLWVAAAPEISPCSISSGVEERMDAGYFYSRHAAPSHDPIDSLESLNEVTVSFCSSGFNTVFLSPCNLCISSKYV